MRISQKDRGWISHHNGRITFDARRGAWECIIGIRYGVLVAAGGGSPKEAVRGAMVELRAAEEAWRKITGFRRPSEAWRALDSARRRKAI